MTRETPLAEVHAAVEAADRLCWAGFDPVAVLREVADRLDGRGDLVEVAERETHLPPARLRGELQRTTFQLRLFAELVATGAHLGVRIDHADPDWPMGAPRPDLRRVLQPLGPVVVFPAGNFPFAFGVAGGDTASALAAGCPVVVKAHPGYPELSDLTGELLADLGVVAVVHGEAAGRAALTHPLVKAGAFTGSVRGGRALFDLAAARPEPIPFYGELGSVNPVFVTRDAAFSRPKRIAEEAVASFTLGAGQFCTKPGVLLVPEGSSVPEALAAVDLPTAPMLSARIEEAYRDAVAAVPREGVSVLAGGEGPTVLLTDLRRVLADFDAFARECFGPFLLVVTYADDEDVEEFARRLDGQLTATVIADEPDGLDGLVRVLARKAGRVLWNQWPTGVSVTHAQHHGGPYPATTAVGSTSVGTAAVERFLRPVAYQNFPTALLPPSLRDDTPALALVDGVPREGALTMRW
ncbi:aldehyde dehydrogenase (NADP(+)) [Saccharothrix variisporea]|uniref:NADP-dependent aldehyde dehydrogenase n=1 Tax=Saccharothrix variisporea TaxID=543527 RepID=A0A495X2F9_9PSEU|nr:aldehyde dehydrogenase (NADP(+)) [Saccharothrix variisporea]RKT67676.1 NADP-dependent aldehyde dehydrogenase [Saccharothrix variisporea]